MKITLDVECSIVLDYEDVKVGIQKFKKTQVVFLRKKKAKKTESIDLKDYTKFVLKEGSPLEQRSILECVSSELFLKNRVIKLL